MKLKSKSIINLDVEIPVYDLEVPGNHNFMLSSGVIVHNSKDIADSLAGALASAAQFTDMDELIGNGNFDSLFNVNEDISIPTDKRYLENYLNQLVNEDSAMIVDDKDIDKDFKEIFDDEVDRFVAKSSEEDKREDLRQKQMKQLRKKENDMMSDKAFENAFFGKDDDIILW